MHDIFNYEPNYYDQKLEQHRMKENRELVFNQLKLGTDNSQWKKDIQSNINGSRCLNGKDGFCWGIGKKSTPICFVPSSNVPETILRLSGLDADFVRISELEKGEPFIAFLLSGRKDYYWIHTTRTEGWVLALDSEISCSRNLWHGMPHQSERALTSEQLLEAMFRNYGAPYRWASGTDCSGYVRNVFLKFGILLPLNTVWQQNYPAWKYDISKLPDDEKLKFIQTLPLGTALYMPHHAMLYLGETNGSVYVISSLGSFYNQSHELQIPHRITVSTLDLLRANGETWLSSLNTALIPWKERI